MTRWRPALRMARRDLWRHKGRTVLTMILVALPVLVGVVVAQLHHSSQWEGERAARETMGGADALVEVTPYERTRVEYWSTDMSARPGSFTTDDAGKRRPELRPRSEVDVGELLPKGSRLVAAPAHRDVALASGGVAHVQLLEADDPMAVGLGEVSVGRIPTEPDEVAISEAAAGELGLLTDAGGPRPGAAVELLDGTPVEVVGLLGPLPPNQYGGGVEMLAAPDSLLADPSRSLNGRSPSHRYLVDLPGPAGEAPHALAASLARHGVAMLPRDLMFNPVDWDVRGIARGPVDPASLAIGALVVLFGLVEVVLIVGSAFAVGARRQVRDLGLVAASGGAPADVRRVLLAQGVVLGVLASLAGGLAGLAAFRLGVPLYEQLFRQRIWSADIDWLAVVGVTLLGSLAGLVAAFIPARSIGRLTPVAALSGRFPVRPGESRAHRPAFALALLGLVVLLLAGWWISVEYAPPSQSANDREHFATPSTLPVVVGAVGLLTLLAGVVWATPYLVRRLAGLGTRLPLSGRFAFRDAARHRFRTAAAAVTLGVTVAGAVFAGFVLQAVATELGVEGDQEEHRVSIYVEEQRSVDPTNDRQELILSTVRDVLGPVEAFPVARVASSTRRYSELAVQGSGRSYGPVRVIDEESLARLVGSDDAALKAFRAGSVVTTSERWVDGGELTVTMSPGRRTTENRWTLPAVVAERSAGPRIPDLFSAWVSEQTVRRLGLVPVLTAISVVSDRAVTSEDLTRLAVHGIVAESSVDDLETLALVRWGVIAASALLTFLVVGMTVALAAAEGRVDHATMAAVGAGPWRRRSLGAMHGLFLGLVGVVVGAVVGLPAGAALMQVDGARGVAVPWGELGALLVVVPLLACAAGWAVTSTRLTLVRRTG